MKKFWLAQAAFVNAICLAIPATSVNAQEEPGGLLLTFGVEQRIDTGRNFSLTVPAEGQGTVASTILSFGLLSETQTQSFSLEGSGALRISDLPGTGSENDLGDASLRLGYRREAANSNLSFNAAYERRDIDFLRAILDFTDDDGEIVLPEDFSDLTGGGIRITYGVDAELEFGHNNLVGVTLHAAARGTDYEDATNPDLTDTRSNELGIDTELRFSPVTTGFVNLSATRTQDDDAEQTDELDSEIEVGVEHEVTDRTRVNAFIGYEELDTDTTVGLVTTNEVIDGYNGGLGIEHDMPNGMLTANYDSWFDEAGRVQALSVGRSLELPNGEFAGRIGVARVPGGDTEVIGGLAWHQEFGPGTASATLSRDISTSSDGEARPTTVLGLGYRHDFNQVSAVTFNISYAETGATASAPLVQRTDFSAVYSRNLTPDWDLNTGISYRVRDETGIGRAESPSFFVSIGREFNVRR